MIFTKCGAHDFIRVYFLQLNMKEGNFAFIDSQNVHLGICRQGWKLDWKKFRVYLEEKYSVTRAYLFLGFVSENKKLYSFLQRSGYVCIFRPTFDASTGHIKGNIDAELVLHTMIQYPHFEKALIATGDGDFYCLIDYLLTQEKLLKVFIPDKEKYSFLFKQLSREDKNMLDFASTLREKLAYK